MRFLYALLIFLLACPTLFGQDSARYFLEKGNQWKEQGNCKEALPYYQEAIKRNPQLGEGYVEMAWCYNELGQYTQALQVLKSAATYLPGNKKVWYETGFAYYNLDSTQRAISCYKQVLDADSSHVLARLGMGDVFRAKRSDARQALEWYKGVLQKDPNNKKAHYWAGWCCNELKDYAQAQTYLQKLILLEPDNRLAYAELGFSHYFLRNYTDAITHLKKAESLPGAASETVIYYLGLCYVRSSQKQEAIKKYNELVLMESKMAPGLLLEIRSMPQ